MKLSIVTTLYNSEKYIMEFYQRVTPVAQSITELYEIIIVDDGSPDGSNDIVEKIIETDARVKLIKLSKNFGHHQAMMTGLTFAKGDEVFIIDCDLEEPPEILTEFYALMRKNTVDVVYGVQNNRKGGFIERFTGNIFYKIINKLSSVSVPKNILTVRLMKRKYVEAVTLYKEKVLFLHGIWCDAGFKQIPFVVKKGSKGCTSYTIPKKIKLAIDSISSFSEKPLVYVFYIGVFILLCSLFFSGYVLLRKLFFHIGISGWTSLILSTWIFGGLILFSLGLIGIYVARIYVETKSRPLTIVKNIVQNESMDVNN